MRPTVFGDLIRRNDEAALKTISEVLLSAVPSMTAPRMGDVPAYAAPLAHPDVARAAILAINYVNVAVSNHDL